MNRDGNFHERIAKLESILRNGDSGTREAFESLLVFVEALNTRVDILEAHVAKHHAFCIANGMLTDGAP
jgi:hypothetical protein